MLPSNHIFIASISGSRHIDYSQNVEEFHTVALIKDGKIITMDEDSTGVSIEIAKQLQPGLVHIELPGDSLSNGFTPEELLHAAYQEIESNPQYKDVFTTPSKVFSSTLNDWDGDKELNPHNVDIHVNNVGVSVDLQEESGVNASVYIEINAGKPAVHFSTLPDNDNDVHIYDLGNVVRVQSEHGADIFEVESSRHLFNEELDDDNYGPR
jgi:hypothetical protein